MAHGARDTHDMQTFRTLDMICSRVHKPDALPVDMESNSILEINLVKTTKKSSKLQQDLLTKITMIAIATRMVISPVVRQATEVMCTLIRRYPIVRIIASTWRVM